MVCQFYLSFHRTSFWLCWFLAMVSFVSFAFFSALIFKISFLLLTLGFSISSFSSCFRCRVRLFIWLLSCFLRCACIAMNFPLRTAFTVSHRFWVVVFSFSFVSMQILISLLYLDGREFETTFPKTWNVCYTFALEISLVEIYTKKTRDLFQDL